MKRPSKSGTEQVSRRSLVLYLAFVALPTALFLYLGFHSVQRRINALVQLSTDEQSGAGQKLVQQIEDRTFQLAENCLLDQQPLEKELVALSLQPGPQKIESAIAFRNLVEPVLKRHPFASQPFLIRNGRVQFPLIAAPPPRNLAAYFSRDKTGRQYERLFRAADRLQAQKQWQLAAAKYQQFSSLPVSDELHALALSRLAISLAASKRSGEAAATWRELGQRFGHLYDPSNTPYSIRAAFGLDEVHDPAAHEEMSRVQSAMLSGRWELSAEQLDKLAKEFQERLGSASGAPTPFVAGMWSTRNLQSALQKRRPGDLLKRLNDEGQTSRANRAGDIFAFAYSGEDDARQSFYLVLSAERSKEILLGFTVNMDWLQNELLPALGQNSTFILNRKGDKGGRAEFRNVFPSWEVVATPAALQRNTTLMDVFILAGSVLLIVLVVAGFSLIYRQMAHERQISQLRIDFVNGVSHELKTPITLIRVYSELLLQEPNLTEGGLENCENISHEAERLTGLVDHILDFSRVDRKVRKYEMQVGDLAPVVERAVKSCRDYLAVRDFRIGGVIRQGLPPVRFDPSAISSIVLNLVDNAVKYSGQSKVVSVSLHSVRNGVVLEVEDQGIGIPREEREKIFEPYYRINTGAARGGCGLGLALIKEIATAHGSKIEVESAVGHGTRFSLIFPVAAQPQTVPAADATARTAAVATSRAG